MKRILLLLLVLLCAFSMISAAEIPGATEGSVSLDGEDLNSEDGNKSASVKVNLALGVDENGDPSTTGQKVVVGFAGSVDGLTVTNYPTEEPELRKSIDLQLNPDNAKATLGANNDLYVFWSVQSSKKVKIDLSVSGALTREGGGTLNWTVSNAETETIYCGSAAAAEGTTYNSTVYDHKVGEKMPIGNAGSVKLAIETTNYSSNVAGNYSAYLYVTVSNGNE